MNKIIDQDGKPLVYRAVYMEFGSQREFECTTPREAVAALVGGLENGTHYPVAVLDPDGNVMYDEDRITEWHVTGIPDEVKGR